MIALTVITLTISILSNFYCSKELIANCKASNNGKIPWDESTKQRRIIVFSLNEIQNFSQMFCPTFRGKT
jgi:hypothetical protein